MDWNLKSHLLVPVLFPLTFRYPRNKLLHILSPGVRMTQTPHNGQAIWVRSKPWWIKPLKFHSQSLSWHSSQVWSSNSIDPCAFSDLVWGPMESKLFSWWCWDKSDISIKGRELTVGKTIGPYMCQNSNNKLCSAPLASSSYSVIVLTKASLVHQLKKHKKWLVMILNIKLSHHVSKHLFVLGN